MARARWGVIVKRKLACQLELALPTWGGRREGAGRKRVGGRPSPPHRVRAVAREWAPQLVTLRLRQGVPSLREDGAWRVIVLTMRSFRGRFAARVVHYSAQTNHLHLLVECCDRQAFARGMKALCVRLAKRLNAYFGRKGPLYASRYHARELTTPLEVWNALRYVLLNERKHAHAVGLPLPKNTIDRRSTAAIFDGWSREIDTPHRHADFGTSPPRSWLLRVGWRKHGRIDPDDIPGVSRESTRRAA